MTDTEAMHEALALAREAADEGEVPVGCIVTDGEHIVGRGRNRRETGKARWPTRSWRPLPRPAARSAAGGCGAARSMSRSNLAPCAPEPSSTPASPASCSARRTRRQAPCGSVTDLFALPYNHRPACEGGVLRRNAQLLRTFSTRCGSLPQSRAGSPPCSRRREEITHEKNVRSGST